MLTKLLEKISPDSKITLFWKDPRKRALVLLTFWIAFIIVIFVVFVIPYNNRNKKYDEYNKNLANETLPEEEEKEEIPSTGIDALWQNLFTMDYEYTILVYNNSLTTEYEGIKAQDEVSGTKTDSTGTSEYYIQDDTIYSVINDTATEYGALSNTQYDKYLNPVNIYNDLKDITPQETSNGYIYENGEDYVIISVSDYINSIEINNAINKYILNFDRID